MKRFTETDKWTKNSWFRKLEPKYKLLWMYILDNCDNVGVWKVDFELAEFCIGSDKLSEKEALELYGDRIYIINDDKWWIVKFIPFQYNRIKEDATNRPHQSYIQLLKSHILNNNYNDLYSLYIAYTKGIYTPKDQDKDHDMDQDMDQEEDHDVKKLKKLKKNCSEDYNLINSPSSKMTIEEGKVIFDEARKLYKGIKRGLDVEFNNYAYTSERSKMKETDWRETIHLLKPAIERLENYYKYLADTKQFVPPLKHFRTWINQRCWDTEYPETTDANKLASDPESNEVFKRLKNNMEII